MKHEQRQGIIAKLGLGRTVRLVEAEGRVISARSFAQSRLEALSLHEKKILQAHIQELPDAPPPILKAPLLIAEKPDGQQGIEALGVGSRSAYLPSQGISLKACRLLADQPDLFFPTVGIDIQTGQASEARIPFGAMTAEAALRELLGFCCLRANSWPTARVPLAVLEYAVSGSPTGYSLCFEVDRRFRRLEDLLPTLPHTLEDLIAARCVREVFGNDWAPGELAPRGVSLGQFAKAKASFLARAHARGVFRGYLNSNTGNDVLNAAVRPPVFTLVDFDTLSVVDPSALDANNRQSFVMAAMIEAAKGLLPILDFVPCSASDAEEAFREVERAVLEKSSFLKCYQQALAEELQGHGFEQRDLESGLSRVRRHPLYRACILDAIPNTYTLLNSYSQKESLYRPQFHE